MQVQRKLIFFFKRFSENFRNWLREVRTPMTTDLAG